MRDIDHAAKAVRTAMKDKYGRAEDLAELSVEVTGATIRVTLGDDEAAGTRDQLMTWIRRAPDLESLWAYSK